MRDKTRDRHEEREEKIPYLYPRPLSPEKTPPSHLHLCLFINPYLVATVAVKNTKLVDSTLKL